MATKTTTESARLHKVYKEKFQKELKAELNVKTVMQVPELKKIVLNIGAGRAASDPKILDSMVNELAAITGQMPVKTKAKNSIAGFKLREGSLVGTMVTLRGKRMYEFLDRLINVALPRVRDFNGLSNKSFDKQGNYTFGIKEQIIFPEINVDQVESIHGMDITFNIKSRGKDDSRLLMEKFKFPFRKK